MPQSLTVGGGSSSGSSVKRQRSADSREVQTRPTSTSINRSSSSLSKMNARIPGYLDKSKVEIQQAFQDLEWKQRFRLFHALENPTTSPFRIDRSEIVISRNRYGNVQPWDNSRIKLKTPLGGSDYVNASPITLRSHGTKRNNPGDNGTQTISEESRYIATQGPKEMSLSHFWHMVMQESTGDIGVIVMLTQCYEANKEKCSQYFPGSLHSPELVLPAENSTGLEEGKVRVDDPQPEPTDVKNTVILQSINEDVPTGSQLRILKLTIDNKSKIIHHYLFHGWPDFGKPEAEDRLALLELIRQTKRLAGESPRIIHCSAGVGRTGTFIALDFLMREIEDGRILESNSSVGFVRSNDGHTPTTETWGRSGPPKVKTPTGEFPSGEENPLLKDDLIYDTVNTLREQRMMMVMNELQYAFLYEVVREVFLDKYKGRPEGAMVKGAKVLSTDLPRGKVAKVDERDSSEGGVDLDGGSGSEAETEIMEGQEHEKMREAMEKTDMEADPYDVVAPEHIRKGVKKEL